VLAHTIWLTGPVIWVAVALSVYLYARGAQQRRRGADPRHQTAFALGVVSIVAALVSPLEPLAESLASAHMIQHLLLIAVAAPLLVVGNAARTTLLGLPRRTRSIAHRVLRRCGFVLRRYAGVGIAVHIGAIWFWHARGPYDAAVRSSGVHALEHLSLFGTALWAWSSVLGVPARRRRGPAMLWLFALSAQSAVLGALLTFAPQPWYRSYQDTTTAYGFDQLDDQRLAGAIMWVPGCSVYLVAALWVLHGWISTDSRVAGSAQRGRSEP
jgi:cytochrome c oxidase assembly factor CtaG